MNIEQRAEMHTLSVPSDVFFFVLFGVKSITKEIDRKSRQFVGPKSLDRNNCGEH